jgi:hypothetical protein
MPSAAASAAAGGVCSLEFRGANDERIDTMENLDQLQSIVDTAAKGVASESLDIGISELVNLHKSGDLLIAPAFQRLFRWEDAQQSRLIESLIIGLPIPQIFMFQRTDGVLELVDGLQRVSSVIRFVDAESLGATAREEHKIPLQLTGCDIVPDLNGLTLETLPDPVRRGFLRKSVRAIIIARTNESTLRFQMFKRLNSGGSPAEYQEVRNATIRVLGEPGEEFLEFIEKCAKHEGFKKSTETIPESVAEKQGREELVLRFFAGKLFREKFRGNVAEWIDSFVEAILVRKTLEFDVDSQFDEFDTVFNLIADRLGERAFVKHREGSPIGGLAPAYFEAVSLAVSDNPNSLKELDWEKARAALAKVVESEEFRNNTGPGANSLPKLSRRIELVKNAFDHGKNP